jgi:hypothetical protein
MAYFGSAHADCKYLVQGCYNVESYGGRFTRKMARLRQKYDAEYHRNLHIRGYYPCLSRPSNCLHIVIEGIEAADIPLEEQDHILDHQIPIPSKLASGIIFVDFEVDDRARASDIDDRLIGILLKKCSFN